MSKTEKTYDVIVKETVSTEKGRLAVIRKTIAFNCTWQEAKEIRKLSKGEIAPHKETQPLPEN